MQHLFWLLPGKLAGRTGPNRDPWDLAALRAAGIGAVISVNDGMGCTPADFEPHDIAYACFPLSKNAPPEPGDDQQCWEALPNAYAFVQEQLAAGRVVLVHCTSGKDRTGMYMAYHLMRASGLAAEAAITEVRRVREIAFSAEGWDAFAPHVLGHV